jgi:hypothetical protein
MLDIIHRLISYLKHDVSEIGFCFRLQEEYTHFDPMEGASHNNNNKSKFTSSTLMGLATRYYFLSKCCCLKFAVLYL